jgi:S-(hydroxymethyl)glutathione dehydrogenase/alcohol dehydrogenase
MIYHRSVRAVILEEVNKPLVVSEVEPVALGARDVRVETGASGVCHSDLTYIRGLRPLVTPIVLGHEGAGRVIDVGRGVSGLTPGDRVITSWVSSCGHCYQCVQGRGHLCELQASLASRPRVLRDGAELPAMTGLGTMAELMTVDEANLVKVETDLPDEQLALIGCGVTTGVGAALWTAEVKPGTSVAVLGCGGVGQATIQGAAIAGAATIIAIDPVKLKREEALRHGATDAVDPADGDTVEQVRALTAGRGAEYTFEVAGRLETMRQAFEAACDGGTVTIVGAPPADRDFSLPANALRAQGKRLLGSQYGSAQVRRDMPRLVKLAESGRLALSDMVSRRVPLSGANEAVEAIATGEVIRSVLLPQNADDGGSL